MKDLDALWAGSAFAAEPQLRDYSTRDVEAGRASETSRQFILENRTTSHLTVAACAAPEGAQLDHCGHRALSLRRSGSFFMRNRITIQTTEELDRALEETRLATGRQTKSDVIRDSLELYDLIVQQLLAGKHLYLGMTRESAGEVLLPHLERAAGRLRPQLLKEETVATSSTPPPLAVVPPQPGTPSKEGGTSRKPAASSAHASTKRRSPTDSPL